MGFKLFNGFLPVLEANFCEYLLSCFHKCYQRMLDCMWTVEAVNLFVKHTHTKPWKLLIPLGLKVSPLGG